MQDELLKEYLSKKIKTVNDLPTKERQEYINNYYNKNYDVIKQYTSFDERMFLNKTGIIGRTRKPPPFFRPDVELIETRIKIRHGVLKIPADFVAVTEAILTKNLKTEGIFRKSPPISKLTHAKSLLYEMTKKKECLEKMIEKLKEIDLITLCSLLKATFDFYDNKLISSQHADMYIRISDIENEEHARIMAKYVHYTFREETQSMLEFLSVLFLFIFLVSTNFGRETKNNLDIFGIIIVLTPKLIIDPNNKKLVDNVTKINKGLEICVFHAWYIYSCKEKERYLNGLH